jgi:mRNA interferase MazF
MEPRLLSQHVVQPVYSRFWNMQTKVQKWGNSLGVRIPRSLAEDVGLGPGTEVGLTAKDGELVLRPAVPIRVRLADLLASVTTENIHASIDMGGCRRSRNVLMSAYVPNRGDLVWLEFTPQAGSEQRGRMPALVLSPKIYNGKVGLTLFCPVTFKLKGYPFEVKLPGGTAVRGVVLSDQLKSLDWRSVNVQFIDRVFLDVMAMVTARVLTLLVPDTPATL